MRIKTLLLTIVLFSSFFSQAEPYKIAVELENTSTYEELILCYFYGDKQMIKDTSSIEGNTYVFEGDDIEDGLYFFLKPDKTILLTLLVDKKEKNQVFKANSEDAIGTVKVKNSAINTEFYEYMRFLNNLSKEGNAINTKLNDPSTDESEKPKLKSQLDGMTDKVVAYQKRLAKENGENMLGLMMKSLIITQIPDVIKDSGDELKKFYFYRDHFLDNLDLNDDRLLRTDFFHKKWDTYLEKLTPQHPDSLIKTVDFLFGQMDTSTTLFKFYLSNTLNKYAKSKIIGFDAVYVHLALEYYANGYAKWVDAETIRKIYDEAKALQPLLIGNEAPDIRTYTQDKKAINFHQIDAKYTLLVIWSPDCGHCKKSMPLLNSLDSAYASKGLKIYTVCGTFYPDHGKCYEFLDEKKISKNMIHTTDPTHESKFKVKYNVKTTPQLYLVDKDKVIISKRLSVEQVGEIIDQFENMDQEK